MLIPQLAQSGNLVLLVSPVSRHDLLNLLSNLLAWWWPLHGVKFLYGPRRAVVD